MKVTKEAVMAALAAGAVNLTGIGKHLGIKGNISGSTTKAIRELVPEIAELLAANKGKPQTVVELFVREQFGGLNRAEEAGAYSFEAWMTREGYTLTKKGKAAVQA